MAQFKTTFHTDQNFKANFGGNQTFGASFGSTTEVHTDDYEKLRHRPTINEVEVIGNKAGADYKLLDGEYATYAEIMEYLNS